MRQRGPSYLACISPESVTAVFRRRSLCRLMGAAMAFVTTTSAATSEDVEPNWRIYCQTFFPGMLPPFSTTGQTPPVCVNVENGKGVLRHIDFAVACEMTTGSPKFYYLDGQKIRCGDKPHEYVSRGPKVHILKPAELVAYCAQALGPGAHPLYSQQLKRSVCTGAAAPGPNPLTINFAFACYVAYKTHKVRYVDAGMRDYVACLD